MGNPLTHLLELGILGPRIGWPLVHGFNYVNETSVCELLLVSLAAIQRRAELLSCFEHKISPPQRSRVRWNCVVVGLEFQKDICQFKPAARLKISSPSVSMARNTHCANEIIVAYSKLC